MHEGHPGHIDTNTKVLLVDHIRILPASAPPAHGLALDRVVSISHATDWYVLSQLAFDACTPITHDTSLSPVFIYKSPWVVTNTLINECCFVVAAEIVRQYSCHFQCAACMFVLQSIGICALCIWLHTNYRLHELHFPLCSLETPKCGRGVQVGPGTGTQKCIWHSRAATPQYFVPVF